MTKKFYVEALSAMIYKNTTVDIKKSSYGDYKDLKKNVIKNGDEEVFFKALKKIGFSEFFIMQEKKDIEFLKNPPVEEEKIALSGLLEEMQVIAILDEQSQNSPYILKEMKKTGINKTHRLIVKNTLKDLVNYVTSKTGVKPEVVDNESIQARSTFFDPKEEALFEKDGIAYFNTWTAPELLCMTKDTPEPQKPEHWNLLELAMLNVFEDQDGVEYVLDVLAYAYQKRISTPSIIIMMGIQGSAKGLLEKLFKAIWTEMHMAVGDKKVNIFMGSDNSMLKDKLIYLLDETPIGGEYYEVAKRYAGNNSFSLKELYSNARQYPNRAIFLNSFNLAYEGEIRFDLSADDRRISIFESKKQIITYPEFQMFEYEELGTIFSEELSEYFAWVLATRDIDYERIKKPYANKTRERWIKAAKDHTEDFYTALFNKDMTYFMNVADGYTLRGFSIVDTFSNIFSGSLDARVTSMSEIYETIFDKKENKDKRDAIVKGRITRESGKKGGIGNFIYKLDAPQTSPQPATSSSPTPPPPPEGYNG